MRWNRLYTCMASAMFYDLTCLSFLSIILLDSDGHRCTFDRIVLFMTLLEYRQRSCFQ